MKKLSSIVYLLLFVSALLSPLTPGHAESPVVVHDAWIMEAPPGMKVMAAYMMIENTSSHDYVLVQVSSPQFRKVEMHRTVMEGGIARMIQQQTMKVEGGKTLEFVPGGSHLMLIDPDRQPVRGDNVEIVLTFNDGSRVRVIAPVQKYTGEKQGQQHHRYQNDNFQTVHRH